MTSCQFGYDAIKTVLQYMSADKRTEISQHIPSLRTVNYVTPLSINTLVFKPNELNVDGITYRIGICREAKEGKTPRAIQVKNREGGIPYDIDQYGYVDTEKENKIYPGDIGIAYPTISPFSTQGREWEEYLEPLEIKLSAYELQLKVTKKKSEQYNKIKEAMEKIMEQLIPLRCRKANQPSPYRSQIQMTKTSESEVVKTEKVLYTKSLPEAMKAITKSILGNRIHPIKVRKLERLDHMIIRVPENLKLDVKVLKLERNLNDALEALAPILGDSTLDVLECISIGELELSLPLLKTAKSLVISETPSNGMWLVIMTSIENHKVILKSDEIDSNLNNYIELVRNWMTTGKPVGTCFTFGNWSSCTIKEIETLMKENFGDSLEIPMENGLKVAVTFEKKSPEELLDQDITPWIMKMEVL